MALIYNSRNSICSYSAVNSSTTSASIYNSRNSICSYSIAKGIPFIYGSTIVEILYALTARNWRRSVAN